MVASAFLFDAYRTCPPVRSSFMPRRRTEPEPVAKLFGDAVREKRRERSWTQEDLGARMGRPDGKYLGEVERGFHSPTITTAKQIADALEVRLVDLVKEI